MKEEKVSLTDRARGFFNYWLFTIFFEEIPLLENKIKWLTYNIKNSFDPLPKTKRKEIASDWLKRIEPKYAIRYTKFMYENWKHLDNTYSTRIKLGGLERHRKKDRKMLSDLANSIKEVRYKSEVAYNSALDRKDILERN